MRIGTAATAGTDVGRLRVERAEGHFLIIVFVGFAMVMTFVFVAVVVLSLPLFLDPVLCAGAYHGVLVTEVDPDCENLEVRVEHARRQQGHVE